MIIKSIYETSYEGMYKITGEVNESTTTFYIRKEYLTSVDFNKIETDSIFNEEETGELLDAGLASQVEFKALEYVARAEQSRFGLKRKLLEKKYDEKYVDMALTHLENTDYLSDARFSRAWLNTRKINHFEGRTKLIAELQNRGINKETAKNAVNEFFTENDEYEICKNAYEKLLKKYSGKTNDKTTIQEKLIAALMQAGFSYSLIKEVKETCKQD